MYYNFVITGREVTCCDLNTEVKRLLDTSHRESSRTYSSALHSYQSVYQECHYHQLPLEEEIMLLFLVYLSLKELRPTTVKVYCSAISDHSIKQGYGSSIKTFLRLRNGSSIPGH
jgi:hypothetical protein